jgi:hypothetical protein
MSDDDIKDKLFIAYQKAKKELGFIFEDSVVPVAMIIHHGKDAQVQVKVTLDQDEFIGE